MMNDREKWEINQTNGKIVHFLELQPFGWVKWISHSIKLRIILILILE